MSGTQEREAGIEPYTPEEISQRIADNEATVFPDKGYQRWAATARALQAEVRKAREISEETVVYMMNLEAENAELRARVAPTLAAIDAFTHADVAGLRGDAEWMSDEARTPSDHEIIARWRNLAGRIAALLPPENSHA